MTETLYRHQDGQNLAELRNYKLVQGQLFKINSKNYYRGVAPHPIATSNIGDTWEELGATGLWIQSWFWNGTYWLSQQTLEKYHISGLINSGTGAGLSGHGFTVNFNFNLFVLNMQAAIFTPSATNTTNYWEWRLTRISSSGGSTQLALANNQFQTANTWKNYQININTHINLALTQTTNLRVSESTIGGSVSKMGTIGYQYKLARI